MMYLIGDYRSPNEELYQKIQKIYDRYYKPETTYRSVRKGFDYTHATDYGYTDLERVDFHGKRVFNAEEYVLYCGTHSDHIVIPEPTKTLFFEALKRTVLENGDKV